MTDPVAHGLTYIHDNYSDTPEPEPGWYEQGGPVFNRATIAGQLRTITRSLTALHRKVDHMSADQDRLNADVAALGTGLAVVAQEIADLKAANPALDFTGLDKAVSDLTALAPVTPPAPPAP